MPSAIQNMPTNILQNVRQHMKNFFSTLKPENGAHIQIKMWYKETSDFAKTLKKKFCLNYISFIFHDIFKCA